MVKDIFYKIMLNDKTKKEFNRLNDQNNMLKEEFNCLNDQNNMLKEDMKEDMKEAMKKDVYEFFCQQGYEKDFETFQKEMEKFLDSSEAYKIEHDFGSFTLSEEMLNMVIGGKNVRSPLNQGVYILRKLFGGIYRR